QEDSVGATKRCRRDDGLEQVLTRDAPKRLKGLQRHASHRHCEHCSNDRRVRGDADASDQLKPDHYAQERQREGRSEECRFEDARMSHTSCATAAATSLRAKSTGRPEAVRTVRRIDSVYPMQFITMRSVSASSSAACSSRPGPYGEACEAFSVWPASGRK